VTGENQSTRVKVCPTANLSTTDYERCGLGSKPTFVVRGQRLTFLNHGRVWHVLGHEEDAPSVLGPW